MHIWARPALVPITEHAHTHAHRPSYTCLRGCKHSGTSKSKCRHNWVLHSWKKTLCILLEMNMLAEWTYILLQTQTDTQEEINPQHRLLLDPIHSCGSHLPPLLPFPLPTFPTTPWKHPNHPASTGMWTLCLVHLLLSLSFSLSPSLSLRCLLYFHPCASTLLAFG